MIKFLFEITAALIIIIVSRKNKNHGLTRSLDELSSQKNLSFSEIK